jgi:hypothetical protein
MSTALALLVVVLPVFLLVGTGYAAIRLRVLPDAAVDSLLAFATKIAVPVLLFLAIYRLDLGRALRWEHLLSFYAAATVSFAGAMAVSRLVWRRRPGESVAVGFLALFSNSVLLGLPIATRAYGEAELEAVFAIIAVHAPYCYLLGILTMEMSRRDGAPVSAALARTLRDMARNALAIGIALGLVFNLAELPLPGPVAETLDLLARASLPVALFGLGGALTRYALRAELGEATVTAGFSLLIHPALALLLTHHVFGLPEPFVRAAVVIAAMPPGINGYLFAAMYGRAMGTAASTVLLGTALSVASITFWLWVLGGATLG